MCQINKHEKMNCKKAQNKFPEYFNNNLNRTTYAGISKHLNNCEVCKNIYSEFIANYRLIDEKIILQPNPFLYTQINQKLNNQKQTTSYKPIYQRILKPVLMISILLIGIWCGIKLGNIYKPIQTKQIVLNKTNEFYFNDIEQEKIELILLNK